MTPEQIHIKFVPHIFQHYDSAGDFWEDENKWHVRISKTEDWRHSALVLVHEIVEMLLTKHHGVDWKDIDKFDTEGEGKDHPDPGTLTSAPYWLEHSLATQIERKVAKMLNIDWKDYDKALDALEYR